MSLEWFQYVWSLLLVIVCITCWFGTLLTLPGNWGIVAVAALAAWLAPHDSPTEIPGTTIVVLVILAGLGEIIEAVAGAAGAAKLGASRRGVILSLVGAIAGSIVGVALGLPIPIPVVGSAIGALLGAAMGAFAGAALGERWKGRTADHQIRVGRAALVGRLWGTVAKLVIGIAMVVLVTVNALF